MTNYLSRLFFGELAWSLPARERRLYSFSDNTWKHTDRTQSREKRGWKGAPVLVEADMVVLLEVLLEVLLGALVELLLVMVLGDKMVPKVFLRKVS